MAKKSEVAKGKTIDASDGQLVPSKLNAIQTQELEKCEEIIRKGFGTFLEVGAALAKIRDEKLFLGKCETFDQYWKKELGISRTYAYNLIGSAEVSQQLSSIEDIDVKPLNEAQLRELIGVKEEKRVDAWKRAVELAGDKPITAKIVRKAAEKFRPRKSGKTKFKKVEAGKIDLEPALKLLTSAEKVAEKGGAEAVLKELALLRRLLEGLGGK